MKLISEQIEGVEYITEEKENGDKSYKIKGVFMQSEVKNRNGRVYPFEVLDKEVKRYNKEYIEENAIAWSVQFISHEEIDQTNILKATMKGMHQCIDDIRQKCSIDTILVDGNNFKIYTDEDLNYIDHKCVISGDNTYKSIAAASILAKTHRDNYIYELVKDQPDLEKYGLHKHKGYGTKIHMDALKEYGPIEGHRRSFKPCF